ncbi:hypothetical protein BABINDRAFT_174095 [Babjeviella inositovora NRRL Y-12698]|uniref:Protein YOP1 n=1 Tax=Babjeviella inositovora NRRL Y-12698 TaxID=984486 RepID=A0A1E3QUT2_9ASCO|nr:uncharacterized protein BABINDRAFT_174095 [Babjeviella inositovora NRRL Y-12698]ODQ81446.1 hypothetical protein BABINDRAFT_174095 [Babjeviella inositovora NRRL Y-12698]
MLGFVFNFLGIAISIAFPAYASYMSLESKDTEKMKPWLIYWTVLSVLKTVEFQFATLLNLLPFYELFRLVGLLWLILPVAPQSQDGQVRQSGCGAIYYGYFKPFFDEQPSLTNLEGYTALVNTVSDLKNSPLVLSLLQYISLLFSNAATKTLPDERSSNKPSTPEASFTEAVLYSLYKNWRGVTDELKSSLAPKAEPVNLLVNFLSLLPKRETEPSGLTSSQRVVSGNARVELTPTPKGAPTITVPLPITQVNSEGITMHSSSSTSLFDIVERSEIGNENQATGAEVRETWGSWFRGTKKAELGLN